MKKTLFLIFGAVIVAAVVAVAVLFISKPESEAAEERAPIQDMFAFYADAEQLFFKSSMDNYLDENTRRTISALMSAEIDNPEDAEYMTTLINNPNESGIDFTKPVFVYGNVVDIDAEEVEVAAILEVVDVVKLDRFFNFIIELGGQEAGLSMEKIGANRFVTNGYQTIGYNTTRLSVNLNNENITPEHNMEIITEALARPLNDLSIFGARDVAIYVDMSQVLDMADSYLRDQIAAQEAMADEYAYDSEIQWHNERMASLTMGLDGIEQLRANMTDDATLIMGLTFDPGRATLDITTDGITFPEYQELSCDVNNDNLRYVDESVIMVANAGINGSNLSEFINNNLPENFAQTVGLDNNQFNLVLGLALDALKSIEGDVMFTLEDLAPHHRNIPSVTASVMMDVTDDYIMSIVHQYANIVGLVLDENNCYNISIPNIGIDAFVGQQDNVLFAGINGEHAEAETPASECEWVDDVDDCRSYIMVDIDNLMNNNYYRQYYSYIINDIDDLMVKEGIDNIMESCDYIYLKNNLHSAEFTIVLEDKETNALQQIIECFAGDALAGGLGGVLF